MVKYPKAEKVKEYIMKNDIQEVLKDPRGFLNNTNEMTFKEKPITIEKPIRKERPEIEAIIEEIKHYYINDERPFAIGYSGGKDSTVTTDLVMKALLRVENPTKPIYLSISDTKLEMDNTVANINNALKSLDEFAKKYGIPLTIKRVEPIPTESYMYLLVGRGYSVPRRDNRWCTDRLKLRPQKREIEEMKNLHSGGYLNVVGTRRAESQDREDRIIKNTIKGMYKINSTDKLSNVLMPVEHMKDHEIWNYIYDESSEWVDGIELGKVYDQANQNGDKECSTLLEGLIDTHEDYKAGCSNSARYGCWICTLFEKDKTLNSLATHYDYMTHMEEFRNWLTTYRDGNWDERDLYNHKEHTEKMYDKDNHRFGMSSVGGYTLAFRQKILDRLLDLDTTVYPERGIRIITDEELKYCQEAWVQEGDMDLTLLRMLEEKQGRTVDISEETYELIDLAKICNIAIILNERNQDKSKRLTSFFHGEMNDRFLVQFALQLKERTTEPLEYLKALASSSDTIGLDEALKLAIGLPTFTKQFFPTKMEEQIIRAEHENDKAYIHTTYKLYFEGLIEKGTSNLFGYDGVHGRLFDHLDSGHTVDEDPNLSLEEKIAFFENWREDDNKERKRQMRTNVLKGRDALEGVESWRDIDYAINNKNHTAEAFYDLGDGEPVSVARLNGRKGIDYCEHKNDIPPKIINMIEDKNEDLSVKQLRASNKAKRDAKKLEEEAENKKKLDAEKIKR